MQRNFLRGLLICLIPCVLAGAIVASAAVKYARGEGGFRLGVDLAGGTILVYEINLERTAQRLKGMGEETDIGTATDQPGGEQKGLSTQKMAELAEQIKRRIDPTDIKNVTVRPLGDRRLEIILPTGGASAGGRENLNAEEIEETKRLISQMGVLEFRILANGVDDLEGIRQTEAAVRAMGADRMTQLAKAGEPPDAPREPYNVKIGDTEAQVRYVWSEMAPQERESLFITNADENPSEARTQERLKKQRPELWKSLADRRNQIVYLAGGSVTGDAAAATMVLFSRECVSRETLAEEVKQARREVGEGEGKLPAALFEGNDTAEIHRRLLANPRAVELMNPKKVEYFVLTRVSPLDSIRVGEGNVNLTARVDQDQSLNPAISFTFTGDGPERFGKITRRNRPSNNHERQLAILLDGRVVSSASIKSEITNQGQITGSFDRKYVEQIVQILKSGALSAELKAEPVSENKMGATLGADTIRKGTRAIGLAFLAVLVFMLWYYRFAGMVACIALFANLLLTIGFMVGVNAAFTLPGLAGLVLTLGMAVDANVLIYERLREERNKGANISTAIRNGYDRAFMTIIDTHLTSIFTAVVLYTFGNDQLKGFAISLTVGLVISLFTSLYMTRLMFDYWQHKKWLTDLKMLRIFTRLNLHPMKYRYIFFPLTGFLTVAGLGVFLARGDSVLNVDFRGGTVFSGKLKPGEERALTTVGEKPGFRELLSKENQARRLNAVKAYWANNPGGGSLVAKSYVYTITYDDGTTATVTLSNKPDGETVEDMAKDVVAHASELPDVSVEQMRLSHEEEYKDGKSRYFTIRTTEKQPELVLTSLDRLLRDDKTNESLLAGAKVEKVEFAGPKATLTFSEPTSEAYLQRLLNREFKKADATAATDRETFKLVPVGEPKDRRYTTIAVDVSENPSFAKLKQPGVPADDPERKSQEEALRKILAETQKAFDTAPEPERLEVFDSTLAGETRDKAFYAILASWIAILVYLWFRFGNWTFGLAAVICLVHDLCFTLGAIAVCHYLYAVPGMRYLGIEDFKIDLAAVAALLTLVGYSVNEIIVNFARVREVRGKNPRLTPDMINDSVNQTLSRTILTAATVFLVSIVLYVFGGEGIHLFAFVMMVGVLIATYSSIFVACPLLLFLGEGREHHVTPEQEAQAEREEKDQEEEVLEG
jgi:SecD/SecF fusion protein